MNTTLTGQLAEFATSDLQPTGLARQMARLSALDWLACGIAGTEEPVSRLLRDQALSEAGAPQATLFGSSQVPARMAALANGTISHALDYDDTHFAHIGHPSVAVIPAALAVAEQVGAGRNAMKIAALIGMELSIRTGLWLGRGHYQVGFHQTATAGAFGAAAAAGR
ncbi:MmgE/PrpD family protein, partial [uncultured Pseudophaeobacter sp.]|uniref:MmgE/PrpD family protein n=1 Tax=uncultured Pseudophaeobacter sp. TaxID=1759421 RepID=UPI0025F5EC0B